MSSKRFRLIMRYRAKIIEVDKVELELHKLAKSLATTSDCVSEALEREEFYNRETEVLKRKATKTKIQLE